MLEKWFQNLENALSEKAPQPKISGEGLPRFESDQPPFKPEVDDVVAKEAEPAPIGDLLQQIADNTAKTFTRIKYRVMRFTIPSNYAFRLEGNYNRRTLNIYNDGPDQVYIVSYFGDNISQGMPIPVDSSLVLNTTDDVYFLSDNSSELRLLEEYT